MMAAVFALCVFVFCSFVTYYYYFHEILCVTLSCMQWKVECFKEARNLKVVCVVNSALVCMWPCVSVQLVWCSNIRNIAVNLDRDSFTLMQCAVFLPLSSILVLLFINNVCQFCYCLFSFEYEIQCTNLPFCIFKAHSELKVKQIWYILPIKCPMETNQNSSYWSGSADKIQAQSM